jgi:hypothetical protein
MTRSQAKLTRTARVRVDRACVRSSGDVLDSEELVGRVVWLGELVGEIAQRGLERAWGPRRLPWFDDPGLPAQGYVAFERAYGRLPVPRSWHVDSRVTRMAGELAARSLRGQLHQKRIIEAILAQQRLPFGTSTTEARNLRRSLRRHERDHGQPARSFTDLRPEPPTAPRHLIPLATTDRQFAAWHEINDDHALLDVKLPVCARPRSRKDWAWHRITIALPRLVQDRLSTGASLSRPSLRISGGRVIADLVTDQPAPELLTAQPVTVLGLDWGERRLLTGTDLWAAPDGGLRSSGRPVFFSARGAQAKLSGLRRQAGRLRSKIDRYDQLLTDRPNPRLQARRDLLEIERQQVWTKYEHLTSQLAHAAARWTVEHAVALGCDTIAHEDLASLEARFPNRGVNGRVNHQVRGVLFSHLKDKASEEGIRVVIVNASGTSSHCPRCQHPVRHHRAPDDFSQGRGWASCSRCGLTLDRDHAAAEHIGRRALAPDFEGRLRCSHRPALVRRLPRSRRRKPRPGRRSSSASFTCSSPVSHGLRAGRVSPGRRVQPGGTPRPVTSLEGREQRPFSCSRAARDLHGLATGFTHRVRLTLTHREPTPPTGYPPRTRKPKNTENALGVGAGVIAITPAEGSLGQGRPLTTAAAVPAG